MIYVDPAIHWWRGKRWCHMFADDLNELHAFATAMIGLKRSWFQDDWRLPHYDITESRRELAIAAGAIEVDLKFVVARMRKNVKDPKSQRIEETASIGSPEKVVVFGLRVSSKMRAFTRSFVHNQDKAGAERGDDQRKRSTQKGRVLSKGRNRQNA